MYRQEGEPLVLGVKPRRRWATQSYGWLLARKFTLNGMPLSPLSLSEKLFFLLLPPLQLLDSLIVIEDCDTENFLGPFLSHNELVQVLLQHLWRKSWDAIGGRSSPEWP